MADKSAPHVKGFSGAILAHLCLHMMMVKSSGDGKIHSNATRTVGFASKYNITVAVPWYFFVRKMAGPSCLTTIPEPTLL